MARHFKVLKINGKDRDLIMSELQNDSTRRLFETISKLKSVEECYAFFQDLCTVGEIRDMAQRLDTAILLDAGESYLSICEKVGISTATISRVSRSLSYGAGGYRRAIDEMSQAEKDAVKNATKQ